MFINYYQLETVARMQNQERLAAALKEQHTATPATPAFPLMTWAQWFSEQKAKWVAPQRPATIEPAH